MALAGTTFSGAKIGGTGAAMSLNAGAGTGTTGAMYSFGAADDPERALGSLASGTQIAGFGVRIENQTGSPVSALFIQFTQENWRSSTGQQNVTAASWARASADAGITDASFLISTSSEFTPIVELNLEGPPPEAANGALDGNLAVNRATRSALLALSPPLDPGDSIFLRWHDANDDGSDAGLAIDDFSVQAVPEPGSAALAAAGFAWAFRRRRR